MKNDDNRKRLLIELLAIVIISLLVELWVSSTASPLYQLVMGNDTSNPVSAYILAGLSWMQGKIPYRDLFTTGSPCYLLFLGVTYRLGGRMLLFGVECMNIACFIFCMYHTLKRFSTQKATLLVIGAGILVLACLCSGGNSAAEWTLALWGILFWMITNHNIRARNIWIEGMVSGFLVLMNVECVVLIVGIILYMATDRRIYGGKKTLIYLSGLLLPMMLWLAWAALQGILSDMISALIIIPIKLSIKEIGMTMLVHKAVKCILLSVPFVLAIVKGVGDRRFLACIGTCGLLLILLGSNEWNRYILILPGMVYTLAHICSSVDKRMGMVSLLAILILIASPGIHHGEWLISGTDSTAELFVGDLKNYLENNPDGEVYLLDGDCSYLLEVGILPSRKYYYNQSGYAGVDDGIYKTVFAYINETDRPDCLVNTVYGPYHEEHYEGYMMVQAYIKPRGNIQIYVAE